MRELSPLMAVKLSLSRGGPLGEVEGVVDKKSSKEPDRKGGRAALRATRDIVPRYLVSMGTDRKRSKEEGNGLRTLRLFLGLVILVAGATKLLDTPIWVGSFERFQFPAWWFFYAVGAVEVLGGILFLFGRKLKVAAVILATVMMGAVVTHLRVGEFGLTLAPLVLLVLIFILIRDNRD
jgi:uncharacterized membrane protein YphA (DoxX/SURF4 family)